MPGVYISFPFCAQKCTYCNFASGVFSAGLQREYLVCLQREIEAHTWCWTPETLYLGGGSPNQIRPEDLKRLTSAIPGAPWKEATIEVAPGSFDEAAIEGWVAAGINRVSLGVQSFSTTELAHTGRKHTGRIVEADVARLRAAGLHNINIDLIAGLPRQNRMTWKQSLDYIQQLEPPHVSVYMLEVDESSRLGLEIISDGSRYGARTVPSDELIVELYTTAVDRLASMGIRQYEISNFARPGYESWHNLKYWLLEPYIGFGADAHSFVAPLRWGNVEKAQDYVQRITAGTSPREEALPAVPGEERFFVSLRLTRGIRPEEAELRRFQQPIRDGISNGLLEWSGDYLRLTRAGMLFSNEILAQFIDS